MGPFTIIGLLMSGVSAAGQIQAGQATLTESQINAKNLQNQKEMNKVVAKQNMIARIDQYKENTSQNIAQFGIGSGRADRSVEAFMRAQKEKVGQDIRTIQTQGFLQEQADKAAVAAERARGKAEYTAAKIGAASTLLGGIYQYGQTK